MTWDIHSLAELEGIAVQVASLLCAGNRVALFGEMGAGKTTFVSALVKALGSEDWVSSPTFSIVQEYDGPLPVRHLDLYRLQGTPLALLDIEHYLEFPQGIVVVEWPDQLGDRIQGWYRLSIDVMDGEQRRITVTT